MTDDIFRMAQEAGFDKWDNTCLSGKSDLDETLAVGEYAIGEAVFRFAKLVAAAEREACAKLLEVTSNDDYMDAVLHAYADDIRARGQK